MVDRHPLLIALSLTIWMCCDAIAQPVPSKLPDSVQIFPAGGRRGSTVPVFVVVEQAPPFTRFSIRGDGVRGDGELSEEVFDLGEPSPRRAPTEIPIHYPRQWRSQIQIAKDAPLGTAHWDISCAAGGSTGTLPFVVGDLPELIESESNSTPETAEEVNELPVTLNGQIHGERDLDYYRFHLSAGQVIHLEMLTRRIGSRLEPTLAIHNGQGELMPVQRTHVGDDPVLAFKPPVDGDYTLQVGNVSYHGSPAHVYRINVTHAATAVAVSPIGAPQGHPTTFTFSAMNGEGQWDSWTREITLPPQESNSREGGGALPTYRYTDERIAGSIPLRILPAEQQVVGPDAPDRQRPQGQRLQVGQVANGRWTRATQTYQFSVAEPTAVDIRLASPAACRGASLVIMQVLDDQGKSLYQSKPAGHPGTLRAHSFIARAERTYTIRLNCLDGELDHLGGYQLSLLPATPDFRLSAGSDCLSVTQGATLEIPVQAIRLGGHQQDIELEVRGLPDSIAVSNSVISAEKSSTPLKLAIGDDFPSQRLEFQIVGVSGKAEESQLRRTVQVRHRGVDSMHVAVGRPLRDTIALTIRHKPVFRLTCEEAYQYAHRGTIYPYKMTLERQNGFAGTVLIQQADRQNRDLDGIQFLPTEVAAGQTEFMMPIYLPETMHINIQSQSQLYTQAYASFIDTHGVKQHFLAVAEKRNMLRTLPTVVKLYGPDAVVTAAPGKTVVASLTLERTSNMQSSMQLVVVDGKAEGQDAAAEADRDHQPWLVQPMTIDGGQEQVKLPIQVHETASPGTYRLRVKVTGRLDAKPDQIVVTSAVVRLKVE